MNDLKLLLLSATVAAGLLACGSEQLGPELEQTLAASNSFSPHDALSIDGQPISQLWWRYKVNGGKPVTVNASNISAVPLGSLEVEIDMDDIIVIVDEAPEIEGGDKPMLGFETITLCPFDRRLVETGLLSPAETAWLNAYHARVREALTPHLDKQDADWLKSATKKL